ncbi:Putative flippase GtrA (transmembrane translocase of bactoprenol-linked glucose) [Thermomonospora echinospora]|uniref:Putative flippase GtrA (Transmembrane translocase of bactoprenol-linked glucose) n=1 Tax=Thermomonospora echinospora TaxID=1992 RepID=A0A1H6BH82_9ACTN|nr:GtrA family protein [Thermomonospora echinospora]SEG60050.1 Putative flippase GtrA (transmembrane translocase of bactoprenol-linked glucose) [Thermomonospora echinospora]
MSTLQRSRAAAALAPVARSRLHFVRELLRFGTVGTVGTVITIGGANLMRGRFWESPVTTVLVPTMLATLFSYLANRHWTFRHHDSDGSGREMALFFGLNGIGMLIQACCTAFTFYTLGLHDALSYNLALLVGLALASAWRYWSYKKWIFTRSAPA